MNGFRGSWQIALLGMIVAAQIVGCGGTSGPKRIPISGSVSYNGKPVERGTVGFSPVDGSTGRATTAEIVDGKFQTAHDAGLMEGNYRIVVIAVEKTAEGVDPATLGGRPPQSPIPVKYSSPDMSGLEISVSADENSIVHQIELQD